MTGNSSNNKSPSPLRVGLFGKCPRCGEGKLFNGFLDIDKSCSECELDYGFSDAGDGPAIFVMLIVGAIVVGAAFWVEFTFFPPLWVHMVLWLPVILGLALGMLRPLKGLLIALQYKNKAEQGRLADN